MPRGDRTGPWGAGPMTGRGAGYCAGYSVPGYTNPVGGYGRGWGFGQRVYPAPVAVQPIYPPAYQPTTHLQSPEQEVTALETIRKVWKQKNLTLNKKWAASKLESKS
jgi:hypothetical protein